MPGDETEGEPHRRQDRRVRDGGERRAGDRAVRNADVPPVVQPQIEQLEEVPERDAGESADEELPRASEGRGPVAQAHGAVESEDDAPPGDGKAREVEGLRDPGAGQCGDDECGPGREARHRRERSAKGKRRAREGPALEETRSDAVVTASAGCPTRPWCPGQASWTCSDSGCGPC